MTRTMTTTTALVTAALAVAGCSSEPEETPGTSTAASPVPVPGQQSQQGSEDSTSSTPQETSTSQSEAEEGQATRAPTPSDLEWPSPSPTAAPSPGASVRAWHDLSEVDRADARATGQGFVRAMWGVDYRTDASPREAAQRASALATDSLAVRLQDDRSSGREDASMRAVREAGGWIEVDAVEATDDRGAPQASDDEVTFTWLVTLRYHGANVEDDRLAVNTSLEREGGKWRVSDMSL